MADTRRLLAALQTLHADNTTAAISAQDIRDFMVSVYPSVENVLNHGAVGDGTTDDTTAIQAAIDAIAQTEGERGGIVFFPALHFRVSQLELKEAVSLLGAELGPGTGRGAVIQQLAGSNKSMIVGDPGTGANESQHWLRIERLHLRGSGDVGDTVGHGVELKTRLGEGVTIKHCHLNDFPQNGLDIITGGTAVTFEDLHCFSNGITSGTGRGINIERTSTSGVWHGLWLKRISGDDNQTALMRFKGIGDGDFETIDIDGVKSETNDAGTQQTVIELDGVRSICNIRNISNQTNTSMSSIIKIVNKNPVLILEMIRSGDNVTSLIDDQNQSTTVAWETTSIGRGPCYYIYRDVEKIRLDMHGMRVGGIDNDALNFRHSVTATLDFPEIAANSTENLTVTVTGATVTADNVAYASPKHQPAPESGLVWSAWVSAADTVTVVMANVTTSAINPASRSWRVVVERYV